MSVCIKSKIYRMKLKGINISVGRSCFVQCSGCYNYFGHNKNLLSTETILNFLKYLKDYHIINKVTLCGGDPLSRPDIIFLLKQIKNLGLLINLDTVGTPLLDDVETVFYGKQNISKIDPYHLVDLIDLLGIPIDGDSNDIMAQFRKKRPKIYEEQLSILEILEAANAKVCINTVVHKGNIDTLTNIYSIIKKYKAIKKWQIFQFMPIGPLGYKNRNLYLISDDSFFLVKEQIEKLVHMNNEPGFVLEFKSCTSRKGIYLLVDSDGYAWVPKISNNKDWDTNFDSNHDRIIFGNITSQGDFLKITQKMLDFINFIESKNTVSVGIM